MQPFTSASHSNFILLHDKHFHLLVLLWATDHLLLLLCCPWFAGLGSRRWVIWGTGGRGGGELVCGACKTGCGFSFARQLEKSSHFLSWVYGFLCNCNQFALSLSTKFTRLKLKEQSDWWKNVVLSRRRRKWTQTTYIGACLSWSSTALILIFTTLTNQLVQEQVLLNLIGAVGFRGLLLVHGGCELSKLSHPVASLCASMPRYRVSTGDEAGPCVLVCGRGVRRAWLLATVSALSWTLVFRIDSWNIPARVQGPVWAVGWAHGVAFTTALAVIVLLSPFFVQYAILTTFKCHQRMCDWACAYIPLVLLARLLSSPALDEGNHFY